jgi:hypothetical protein
MKSSTLETGHKLDKQDIAPAITMIEVKQGPFAGDIILAKRKGLIDLLSQKLKD